MSSIAVPSISRAFILFVAAAALAGCAKRTTGDVSPAIPEARDVSAPDATKPEAPARPPIDFPVLPGAPRDAEGRPVVAIKHVSTHGLKPPLSAVRFDIALYNDRDEPRWFLMPSRLESEYWLDEVSHLQRTELHGSGVVLIGRAEHGSRFNILKLPPRGRVVIRNLAMISRTMPVPPAVTFELLTAKAVRIGSEPMEAWFLTDPTAPRDADVDDDRWQLGKHELPGRHTPDTKPAAVVYTEDRRIRLQVPLDGKKRR